MKKLLAATLTLLTLPFGSGVAAGAEESVDLSFAAKPISGSLLREVPRPIDGSLKIVIKTPSEATTVVPMIRSNVRFPKELSFNPKSKITPSCPASKVGPDTKLSLNTASVVALCPDSVVGTGRASIYAGGSKGFVIDDPELTILNAGRDKAGRPKITIYGFSQTVNSGILMYGVLEKSGDLNIAIGVLPYDSATAEFVLGMPGEPISIGGDGSDVTIKGLDPGYLRGTCRTGTWTLGGKFDFAKRDEATAQLLTPITTVAAQADPVACKGLPGSARLSKPVVKGPRTARRGSKITYRVKVANRGTATARSLAVTLAGAGAGTAKVKKLPPGGSRVVKVRARLSKNSGKRARLIFKVRGQGAKASSAALNLKFVN